MPVISCHHQLLSFGMGIQPEHLFALGFQQKLNGFLKIGQTFLAGLALTIGTGNL